jgi:hypothetical protein
LKVALARDAEDGLAASWDGTGGAEIPRAVHPRGRFHAPASEPGSPTEQTEENAAERAFEVHGMGWHYVHV